MGLVTIEAKGSFKNTKKFFNDLINRKYKNVLAKYGELGVQTLSVNTPIKTGKTASSWSYEIVDDDSGLSIVWKNSNVVNGYFNVALMLQYGHGTRNGGYVTGIDYINPSLQPIFDKMAEAAWKEVQAL